MVLNGKKLGNRIKKQLKTAIQKQRLKPGLAVVLIGKDPESVVYINLKQKAAQNIGIRFRKYHFPSDIEQEKITGIIKRLNKDKNVHGIIVQMPLPKHLDPDLIVKAIAPEKDVDGFQDRSRFISPTHQGIIRLIKASEQNLKGKNAVVICKNSIFADPLVILLQQQNIKASWTVKPSKHLKTADIIIVALGKPKAIKREMVKKNAIVIDVGYTRVKGRPVGDVDPEVVKKVAYVSPVPGGVGPLTVAYLLRNVYIAAKRAALQTNKKW